MIEHMEARATSDWYDRLARRAIASKRRSGEYSSEWPEFAPPVALSDGPLGAAQAADREIARQTAIRDRALAEFAASRPASSDRARGEPGAMSAERWASRSEILREVSEWAPQELVVALSIGAEAAERRLVDSLTLVHRLPGTLAALEAGALHTGHLWTMIEKVAPIEDPTVRAEVEAELLRWAAGRVTTPAQLGAKARREVLRRDARAAARQLEKAIRERGVHVRPHAVDGMAAVTALLTVPEAQVLVAALGAYVDAIPDDPEDSRTRGQKMADCLLDRVLRPGEADGATVQVLLTVVASIGTLAGGDEPGEIDGHVVPAHMVRELLRLFGPGAGSEPAAPVSDESDSVPPPSSSPPWQQVEQEGLERWWAEMERRVLSGELGTGPEPLLDDETLVRMLSNTAYASEPAEWAQPEDETCSYESFLDEPAGWARPHDEPPDRARPHDGPPDRAWPHDEPPDDELAGRERPDHEPRPWEATDREPPERHPADADDVAPDPQGSTGSVGEVAWWADADRAVDDAGRALLAVDRALSRARQLVGTAMVADAADEARWQEAEGRFNDADDALAVLRGCTAEQRLRLADLLSATGGGGLAERPRIVLTDSLTGALLALTDLPEMRRVGTCGARLCRRDPAGCDHDLTGRPGLGPPGPTDGYRPSAPLDRWVRARDRRCRFPGCRRRVPRGGELDHGRPYPLGPTSAANLAGYCTGHHRGKHQAPGWLHELAPDGTLTVTTPTGLTAVTTPAPY
jgi:hypothetical protein